MKIILVLSTDKPKMLDDKGTSIHTYAYAYTVDIVFIIEHAQSSIIT